MMMIPVSCRHNTWSLLHVYPRRNTHEVRLGSRGPSTPHFVGVLLDLGNKAKKKEDNMKYTGYSRLDTVSASRFQVTLSILKHRKAVLNIISKDFKMCLPP